LFVITEQSGTKVTSKAKYNHRPIANKYSEGKMKRTLKRELTNVKLILGKRLAEFPNYIHYNKLVTRLILGMISIQY